MPENGAIYIPKKNLEIVSMYPNAEIRKNENTLHSIKIDVNGDTVILNVMPESKIKNHLDGFIGYVNSLKDSKKNKKIACKKIRATMTVLGLNIDSSFDKNPSIYEALLKIAELNGGFLFTYNSIYLPDGEVLVGPMKDIT